MKVMIMIYHSVVESEPPAYIKSDGGSAKKKTGAVLTRAEILAQLEEKAETKRREAEGKEKQKKREEKKKK